MELVAEKEQFCPEQNALVVRNAEEYYRSMFGDRSQAERRVLLGGTSRLARASPPARQSWAWSPSAVLGLVAAGVSSPVMISKPSLPSPWTTVHRLGRWGVGLMAASIGIAW